MIKFTKIMLKISKHIEINSADKTKYLHAIQISIK